MQGSHLCLDIGDNLTVHGPDGRHGVYIAIDPDGSTSISVGIRNDDGAVDIIQVEVSGRRVVRVKAPNAGDPRLIDYEVPPL